MAYTRAEYQRIADKILSLTEHRPTIGLVLGSGLSSLADAVENPTIIPYDMLEGWPVATVKGHNGRLIIGELQGKTVLVQQGRAHYYEGYDMSQITLAVRVMKLIGIETLIVTNAAGGLNQDFTAGELMLINDHISMLGLMGLNPLRGPNDESFGTRFPDMTHPYDADLRALARAIAAEHEIPLQEGVYCQISGPTFETPAEVKFLHMIGADAVGMSTAPSVIVARHAGMRVLGISSITNKHDFTPDEDKSTTHEEVLEVGQIIVPRLMKLLEGVLQAM